MPVHLFREYQLQMSRRIVREKMLNILLLQDCEMLFLLYWDLGQVVLIVLLLRVTLNLFHSFLQYIIDIGQCNRESSNVT